MKTKTMRILSALLVILMTVNALGTLSLTVSAATRNTGTWGEITTEGVLSYADFSFRNGHEGTEEDPYEISTAAQLAGLAALEREGDTSEVGQFVYPTNDAAFDAACDALKGLLSEG